MLSCDQYLMPATLVEALQTLADAPAGSRLLAGATDTLPWARQGRGADQTGDAHLPWVIDISRVAELQGFQLDAGRKHKIRPGDILGALTGDAGLSGSVVGKIDIFDMCSFVAVERSALPQALSYLARGRVKGRNIRGRRVP